MAAIEVLRIFGKPKVLILVLCTANVCRSPAAEALLRAYAKSGGLHRRLNFHSAGTSVGTRKLAPDPRMVSIANEMGVRVSGRGSRAVSESLVESAKHIWVMDRDNLRAVRDMFPNVSDRVELFDPRQSEILDPYFGSKRDVRNAFELIDRCAEQRITQLAEDAGH